MKISHLLACSTLISSLSACNQDDAAQNGGQTEIRGTGLRSIVLADGVAGFDYRVDPVDCASGSPLTDGDELTAHVDLVEGMTLPANLSTFIRKPFESDSKHSFADHFFTLAAGCYDVSVTPFGDDSDACSAAQIQNVEVLEGKTTEKMLISQCEGVDPGALDVIATLNHEPVIEVVDFQPSKFFCVDDSTQLCVTASDPDNDPLRYEVTFDAGVPCTTSDIVAAGDEQCLTITCTEPGSYVPHVTVYDQAYDLNGDLVDIEELLPVFGGQPELTSHSSLDAIIHVGDAFACGVDTDSGSTDSDSTGTDTTGTDTTSTDTGSTSTDTGSTSDTDTTSTDTGSTSTDTGSTSTDTGTSDTGSDTVSDSEGASNSDDDDSTDSDSSDSDSTSHCPSL